MPPFLPGTFSPSFEVFCLRWVYYTHTQLCGRVCLQTFHQEMTFVVGTAKREPPGDRFPSPFLNSWPRQKNLCRYIKISKPDVIKKVDFLDIAHVRCSSHASSVSSLTSTLLSIHVSSLLLPLLDNAFAEENYQHALLWEDCRIRVGGGSGEGFRGPLLKVSTSFRSLNSFLHTSHLHLWVSRSSTLIQALGSKCQSRHRNFRLVADLADQWPRQLQINLHIASTLMR